MKRLLFLIILLQTSILFAQKDVELVVANGLNYVAGTTISHDNKLAAECAKSYVVIWDIPTGRMIRKVVFSGNPSVSADSCWFSPDNSKVVVSILSSNDKYHIDVASGNVEHEAIPIDWTTYKYVMPNFLRLSNFLGTPGKGQKEFKSPDGNCTLVLKKVPFRYESIVKGQMIYEVRLKTGNKLSEPLDSTFFATFAFSEDSKYLVVGHKIYNTETARVASDLKITPPKGYGTAFLPGTHIPVTSGVNGIVIWDFPNIKTYPVENLSSFRVINGGQQILLEKIDEEKNAITYSLMDLKTGQVLRKVDQDKYNGYIVDIASDGSRISISRGERRKSDIEYKHFSSVIDTKTGKMKTFPDLIGIRFTNDPDLVIMDSANGNHYRYNLKTKSSKRFPESDNGALFFPTFTYNSDFVIAEDLTSDMQGKKMVLFDKENLEMQKEFAVDPMAVSCVRISKKANLLAVYCNNDKAIHLHDLSTGDRKLELLGHTDDVFSMNFSDDGKRLVSLSADGTCKLWNLETGKLMVSLVSAGENEYAIINPDQYYYSTKGAQKLIHFVRGKNIYPFQQFDLKYNRPDIILESLEASNQDLIKPFNLAYQKRLKRLGFTEEMLDGEFHMPKISISNKEDLPLFTDNRNITLAVHGIDSKYKLDRLIVRINGVPIHGKLGQNLRDKSTQHFKDEVDIILSRGSNRISVSVMNEKGVESITANADVEYHAKDEKLPKLYLVTLGVSKYANDQFNLNYAAKDANDLAKTFENQHLPFGEVVNIHLENEEVDLAALEEIKKTLNKSSEDDVVCLFFAGHGLLDADLNYFLAAHNVNFQDPADGGIPYELFENLVDGIPARKKIMMIDACHSGEIDKDEVAWAEETSEVKEAEEDVAFRSVTTTGFKQVGLTNSFELMKELFADIRKSSGALIISSAGGTEYAMEGSDWNNGVFTYSLLNGIKSGKADLDNDGQVMVSEINQYIRKKVVELTNGRQSPTNRTEILDHDWRMW